MHGGLFHGRVLMAGRAGLKGNGFVDVFHNHKERCDRVGIGNNVCTIGMIVIGKIWVPVIVKTIFDGLVL